MPNISENARETVPKLSGFFGVIPMTLCAKYGGDLTAQFLGRGGKVETLTPYISKMGVPGESNFFCAVGGL